MRVRVPVESELGLGLCAFICSLLRGHLFSFFALLLLLFVVTIEFVTVLEDPLTLAVGFVVREPTLVECAVGIDPLA